MNLQQLRYVVATADHGTMTRAAAECHVAQPALSRAVRALERELDLELFTRFWTEHPDVPVRFVHCASRHEVAEAVASGRADAGVTDLPVDDGLVVVPFEAREVVVVAPPGSALPDPLPLDAVGDLALVLPGPGSLRRTEFDRLFADLGIAPTVAFESDERASWIPAVLAGVGCCIWYRVQGQDAALLGAEVRSVEPALHRTIAVVHRPGPINHAVSALVAVAERHAAAGPSSTPVRR